MTPKEKAEELLKKFLPHSYYIEHSYDPNGESRACAIICVKEIMNCWTHNPVVTDYWIKVKLELEKL